jgi:hypothetical protein
MTTAGVESMSSALAPTPPAKNSTLAPGSRWRPGLATALLAVLFAAVLVANLPVFVCMPLDSDVSLWDLYAQIVHEGGVAYRDLLENNFPGMLWAHLAIRSTFGWRSEVLRAADVMVVASIIVLLVRWLPAGSSTAWRLLTALVLASFYLTTSEWCHCQRDTWMLLPALLAVGLRQRQLTELTAPRPRLPAVVALGVVEGTLWGAAFWIKPHVAVPCVFCWLVGARQVVRVTPGRRRWLACDASAVLAGGMLAGAAGCAWLIATGAWSDFWDVMSVWNREYVGFNAGRDIGWLYYVGPAIRMAPWPLMHFAAAPLAVNVLLQRESTSRQLLAALYLGWLGQAVVLQHVYDYVHVPALLLGIAVLCQQVVLSASGLPRTLAVALLLLGVGTRLPALTAHRLAAWSECWSEGSSVAVRDRLTTLPLMNWHELEQVRTFLTTQGVRDGELTTLSMRTVPLYRQLGVRPASRYVFLENILLFFARQRDRVYADLAASRQRFVVCDVLTTRWRVLADEAAAADLRWYLREPESVPYPRQGLVFRAGRYAVYAVGASDMPGWLRENLEL